MAVRSARENCGWAKPPSLKYVCGSNLEHANFVLITPGVSATLVTVKGKHVWKTDPMGGWAPMVESVDALIYLGGDATSLYPSPTIYLEPAYQQELRRRVEIIKEYNGQDIPTVLDDLIKEAKAGNE